MTSCISHNAATSVMLKIQMADTDIDINSHNYHKIDTRHLRLGLVHGWHCMVGTCPLIHRNYFSVYLRLGLGLGFGLGLGLIQ